ncbi:3-deoxy-8-phosphooctulonate synthase [Bacteroidota bacterium]
MTLINSIPKLKHLNSNNFFLIAGPCVVEGKEMCFEIAEKVNAISDKYKIPYIFKASYKKANRSRLDSFTGIGDIKALEIIREVGEKFNIPTITDIHSEQDAIIASEFVDILQIPAFLCRQTDLLVAAAKTNKHLNIKKGQFLSGESMKHVVEKVRNSGNNNIMLTERGSMFGYQDLVVDYRNIPIMQGFEVPVVLDITHSLQQPNQKHGVSGGLPNMIEIIAKAGIAIGVDGIFVETHPDTSKALSDGANMLKLSLLDELIGELCKIRKVISD